MPTANIYGSKMIYVNRGSPSSTLTPGASLSLYGWYDGDVENVAYMAFDIPDNIKRKHLLNGTFYIYAKSERGDTVGYYTITGGYKDNFTWNSKPPHDYNFTKLGEGRNFVWIQKHYGSFWTNQGYKTGCLGELLRDGAEILNWSNDSIGQIHTPNSSSRPYVTVAYEPIYLEASASPVSGFVDKHKEIKLIVTASATTDEAIEIPMLRSATIQWRDGESAQWNQLTGQVDANANWEWYKRIEFVIPPDSVTAESLHWRIANVVSNDGVITNFSAVNVLSTVDSLSTAVPVSPVNVMINVETENEFQWQHVIATGSDPTGFDVQYTIDGLSWQTLESKTGTAETVCIAAANALPAGKLQWRVRTYNGDGVAGEWSEPAAIIGYGAPPAPIISEITNSARPTIRWQSATQIAYELIIQQDGKDLLHVGETVGTDKAYTVSDFLQDGTYTVLVRIKNSGLYWSQWASVDFTIRTEKPAPPIIAGQQIKNGVAVSTDEGPDALYLLRDGVPIAKLYGGQAVDYGVVGPHEYVVRRVSAAGAFADSAPLVLETKVEQAVIAPADDPRSMIGPLLQAVENEYPSTANLMAEMKHYAGRRYPVAVTDGTIEEEYSPVFAALNPAHWRALRSLMEEAAPVLYRNSAGDCAYCLIIALNPTKAHSGYMTWETTMTRVDYVERIEYE